MHLCSCVPLFCRLCRTMTLLLTLHASIKSLLNIYRASNGAIKGRNRKSTNKQAPALSNYKNYTCLQYLILLLLLYGINQSSSSSLPFFFFGFAVLASTRVAACFLIVSRSAVSSSSPLSVRSTLRRGNNVSGKTISHYFHTSLLLKIKKKSPSLSLAACARGTRTLWAGNSTMAKSCASK